MINKTLLKVKITSNKESDLKRKIDSVYTSGDVDSSAVEDVPPVKKAKEDESLLHEDVQRFGLF